MPRNPNLRIGLELRGDRWFFTLHRGDGQSHHDHKGYPTPDIAADEAMKLNSIIRLTKDSVERRQRRMDANKPPGPIVEAPKHTEATTQPTAEDWNV